MSKCEHHWILGKPRFSTKNDKPEDVVDGVCKKCGKDREFRDKSVHHGSPQRRKGAKISAGTG